MNEYQVVENTEEFAAEKVLTYQPRVVKARGRTRA